MAGAREHRIRVPATIDAASAAALADAIESAVAAGDRGVIVLEGTGDGVFCRGMNFGLVENVAEAGETERNRELDGGVANYSRCMRLIRSAARPVIALVDGECLAGGVGLAAASDVLLATERSTFGLSEVLFGLIPAMVMPVLMERMPPQKARLMTLGAATFDAKRAYELGLVDVLVPDDGLARASKSYVKSLARADRRGVESLKRFTNDAAGLSILDGVKRGASVTRAALADPTVRANIERFMSDGTLPYMEDP